MTTPLPPTGPDDDRDPRVAEWLTVEPLDEVTRARLVRAALDRAIDTPDTPDTPDAPDAPGAPVSGPAERSGRPRLRILAVAAALLVAVLVGLAVLVPRGSDSSPTAVRAPTSRKAPAAAPDATVAPPAAAAEAGPADAGLTESFTVPSIGDLGDVSTPARLERAASRRLGTPAGTTTMTVTGCAASAGRAFGTPVAAGRGTLDGHRATVVVAEQTAGPTAVVAVRGPTCGHAVSVLLP